MNKTAGTEIRNQVKDAYSQALKRAADRQEGCCGSEPVQAAGAAAGLVDYSADAAGLPDAALGSSFGCGNPLALAGLAQGDVVLDLGSGAGLDLLIASRKVGTSGRVIGVDMNEEMMSTARRNIRDAGVENIELRRGIIEELHVDDGSVDWLISNCVINLSPEKNRVFAEISRVLKPGGQFSISDIVAEDLPEDIRRQAQAYAACIGGAISEPSYRQGLESAGLVEVQVDDRLVYDAESLRRMTAVDLAGKGEVGDAVAASCARAAGKVWSARITGRKPLQS